MNNFKKEHTFEEMKTGSCEIRKRHPGRVPIIIEVEEAWYRSELPPLDKNKYLVPYDLTMGQFIYVIRKRMKLDSTKALFIMIDGILPPTSDTIGHLDAAYCDETGYLFCSICASFSSRRTSFSSMRISFWVILCSNWFSSFLFSYFHFQVHYAT